ncbi:hypothetical protein EV652_10671 [Kribbella steppae]|uniref:Uncharacterized protein n=1 Tax=Kribbella steppae TaxID=2512223 RepID=A0A4R2HGS9_9ACTN|nr:hypothetical protein EV652_10671 [Kribbella steppae]
MAKPRRNGKRFERGQPLVIAGIAAIATIGAALIGLVGGDGHSGDKSTTATPSSTSFASTSLPTSSMPPTNSSSEQSGGPSIAITSWSERPIPPPPGRRYRFTGTAQGPLFSGSAIFVVARPNPQTGAESATRTARAVGKWLVSPEARVEQDGRWTVEWDLPNPPAEAEWIAVVWWPAPRECPSGVSTCEPDARQELSARGPRSTDVQAFATAPPGMRRTE